MRWLLPTTSFTLTKPGSAQRFAARVRNWLKFSAQTLQCRRGQTGDPTCLEVRPALKTNLRTAFRPDSWQGFWGGRPVGCQLLHTCSLSRKPKVELLAMAWGRSVGLPYTVCNHCQKAGEAELDIPRKDPSQTTLHFMWQGLGYAGPH